MPGLHTHCTMVFGKRTDPGVFQGLNKTNPVPFQWHKCFSGGSPRHLEKSCCKLLNHHPLYTMENNRQTKPPTTFCVCFTFKHLQKYVPNYELRPFPEHPQMFHIFSGGKRTSPIFLGCFMENKMKPTNPNADTYVEEQKQCLFRTFSSEPTCGTP